MGTNLLYYLYYSGLVNPNMPRTFGDGLIHKSHLDAMCHTNRSLPETPFHQPTAIETKIGQTIADSLVEDGATLQMGNSDSRSPGLHSDCHSLYHGCTLVIVFSCD